MLTGLWHCQTEAIIMELLVLYVHITRTFSAFGEKVNAIRILGGWMIGHKVQFQSIIYYSVVGFFLGSYMDHLCSLNSL